MFVRSVTVSLPRQRHTLECRTSTGPCNPSIGEPPSSERWPLPGHGQLTAANGRVADTFVSASGTQPPSRQGLRVTPLPNAESVAFWLSQ